MTIKQDSYLRPDIKTSNLGDRKRKNGMFMNPPSFPGLGGFTSEAAYPPQEADMALEKGPSARGRKPLG